MISRRAVERPCSSSSRPPGPRIGLALLLFASCLGLLAAGPGGGRCVAQELPGSRYHTTIYGLEIERRIADNQLREDLAAYRELQKGWRELANNLVYKRSAIDRMILENIDSLDPETLATQERELQSLRAQFSAALDESQRVRERISERVRLIGDVGEHIEKLRRERHESEGPLSGVWDVSIMPIGEKGIFVLSQDGPQVVGEYLLGASDRGSLEGTFVDGQVRLIRRDGKVGNHSVLRATYSYNTQTLNGTWQKFDLSGGITSGDWVGRKKEEGELPEEEPPPAY
jgi:hypothetical protein